MEVNDNGQPGCSKEITENDGLLGYITHMSPVMTSGAKKYFNCHIHTKKETRRAVCFSPEKKHILSRVQEQKSPVKITKFSINLKSPSKDIILNKDTQISPTVLSDEDAFTLVTVSTDDVTPLDALKDAVPEQFVTIKAKLFSLNSPKKIITRNKSELTKQDGTLVDPTGQINIVLWQDQVDSISEGNTYLFKHIKVKDNQFGGRYVNPPKNTTTYSVTEATEFDDALPEVQLLPDTVTTIDVIACGVKEISFYKACFSCNSKVEEKNGKHNCLKCRMQVNLALCTNQCYMRLSFMIMPDHKVIQLSIFSKESAILASLLDLDINKCTQDDLSNKLFNVGMLTITYDSATNKLIAATKKDN